MSEKQSAEFAASFGWNGWNAIPGDGAQIDTGRPLTFSAKSRQDFARGLRLGLYAFAFLSGGAFLFSAGFCMAVVFLTDSHCGSTVGHYGCEILANTEELHTR